MRILKHCSVLILSLVLPVICLAQSVPEAGQPAVDLPLRPKVDYSAQDLRDPFAGPGANSAALANAQSADKKPLPELSVQGVIWGGNFPQAIVNNKVLKEGDTIEGVKIKTITKECITVLFEGSETKISSPAAGPGAGTKS
jgi:hypothetical protein